MAGIGFELSITNFEKFKALKLRLKEADRQLKLEFNARVRAILAPLKNEIPESAERKLPHRGGLAKKVAQSKFSTRSRALSISFVTQNPLEIKPINDGMVRHPVFGRVNDPWVTEKVQAGFWDEPIEKTKPEVLEQLNEAMDDVIERLE